MKGWMDGRLDLTRARNVWRLAVLACHLRVNNHVCLAQVEQLEAQMSRMTDLLTSVEGCGEGTTDLSDLEAVYHRVSREFPEEYVLFNLSAAALSQALPRFQSLLSGWAPLHEPLRGAAEFRRWRALLDPQGASSSGAPMFSNSNAGNGAAGSSQDPYTQLVFETVLPPLRAACTSWQPREPEALLAWMDAWEGMLPREALSHILDMLVMPALRRAVTEWEPRQDPVPIHVWLHPWLHLLKAGLEELYPIIRGKLSMALQVRGSRVTPLLASMLLSFFATAVQRMNPCTHHFIPPSSALACIHPHTPPTHCLTCCTAWLLHHCVSPQMWHPSDGSALVLLRPVYPAQAEWRAGGFRGKPCRPGHGSIQLGHGLGRRGATPPHGAAAGGRLLPQVAPGAQRVRFLDLGPTHHLAICYSMCVCQRLCHAMFPDNVEATDCCIRDTCVIAGEEYRQMDVRMIGWHEPAACFA